MDNKKRVNAGLNIELPSWMIKTGNVLKQIGHVLAVIGKWIYRLRGFFMAIPVALAALYLASRNMTQLPEEVGINLLETGEYQFLISRSLAVIAPLAVTGVCILMMWLSRKTVYPWIISIFSLVLPLLIWVTNVFPA